ncbi:MAG: hypothetical protein A3J59_04800 [Candidatus Buchananbacteria bacterium RIFCSPHIGHO2_02_FULL_56_16]|uniref:Peptidase S74 domain-containing protein n=1 Tax=Candidatus Buchananbacteria bacterium RIFCSPHIGHO2_02_FULL_56_16 TaxID=1797542 RepID=A0A1G1YE74_9BACT|nr:MAG: hypothetical protein A3J59_04800 [Candidatus Buchananbacteria bacterium RIFCSPHIGHO2_02_FULL_56_16]
MRLRKPHLNRWLITTTLIVSASLWFGLQPADRSSAAAGINAQINYQGKLADSNGNQVSDASRNFKFEIWSAASGGTLLWTERWTSTTTQVSTVNGIFSAALGSLGQSDSLSSVDWNSDSLYLQVDLDADANGSWEENFTTRKRFSATSYAFNADEVDGIHATSTAAVANYLLALDSTGSLNLFSGGVSSTQATTTFVYFQPRAAAPDGLEGRVYYDDANGTLYVHNGSSWQNLLGGRNQSQFWSYDYAANTISTVTSTTQLIASAASRLGTINATTTNVGTFLVYTGSTLNGLTTATDLRPSMLNATTTNIGTLTLFGELFGTTGRFATINATTTNVGVLSAYSGGSLSGLFTATDFRPSMLNATTTNIGTLTTFLGSTLNGLTTATDLRPSTLNATTTNIGTLTVFTGSTFSGLTSITDLRATTINATTTNVGTLTVFGSIQGNVTSTQWFNIGTTDVVGTLGATIGAGDLFVGRNATTTGNLTVASSTAMTTGIGPALFVNAFNNRVGIGTTTPAQALDVAGKIAENGTVVVYLPDQTNFLGSLFLGNGGTSLSHVQDINGQYNSAVGLGALYSNTTGNSNTAVGYESLYTNTIGYYNAAVGLNALYSNTDGYRNSALGYVALNSNTTGYDNSAVGSNSLGSNTTGYNNSAVGKDSLFSNTTGYSNSAVGRGSLYSNTTGYFNSALGDQSGANSVNGSTLNETSTNSVYLGYLTKALADGDTNEIVIGASAIGLGSNTAVLGNDSIVTTALKGNVGIGDTSPLSLFTVGSGDKFRVDASGNATTSGWFNIGTTDVINTLGSAIGAGDLFVGDDATITGSFTVSSFGAGILESDSSGLITATAGIDDLSDAAITSATIGDILYYTGSSWVNSATTTFVMQNELDTYAELNALVADVTLTHNGLIDTFSELDTIVADKSLFNLEDNFIITGQNVFTASTTLTVASTTQKFSTPTLCIGTDCRTAWPAVGGQSQFWSYDYAANTISTVTSTTQLIASAASRLGTINATTTNVGAFLVYTGSTLNGLTTATDLRPSMLNATTTNIGTLTTFLGSTLNGLTTATDLRPSMLNATTTNIGTLTVFTSSTFSGLTNITDLRATSLNATSTNVDTLTIFSSIQGNVTSTGWFNIGTTDVVNTLGATIGAGDLFVGDDATITGSLIVSNGPVGIGTASPSEALDVNGSLNVSGGARFATSTFSVFNTGSSFDATTTNIVINPYPTTGWVAGNSGGSTGAVSFQTVNGIPQMTLSDITYVAGYPRIIDTTFSSAITGDISISFEAYSDTNGASLTFSLYEAGFTKHTFANTLTTKWARYTGYVSSSFNIDRPYFLPGTNGATYYIRRIQVENQPRATAFYPGTRSDGEAVFGNKLTVLNAFRVDASGNATSSGWFNIGTTDVVNTLGATIGAGDLFVGDDATVTGSLDVRQINTAGNNLSILGGNVGIGNTTPLSLFTVGSGDKFRVDASGNATSSGWFNVGTTDVIGTLGATIGAGDLFVGSDATITNGLIVDAGTLFVDAQGGQVGIGTTQPAAVLHIVESMNGNGLNGLMIEDSQTAAAGVGGVITFRGAYTGTTVTTAGIIRAAKTNATAGDYGFDFVFNTRVNGGAGDGTERMRIMSTGNVGIGDTTPLSLFTVGSGDKFRVDASGNATSSGWFNIGTTDVVNTLGATIGAGDLFVGDDATVTGTLIVSNGPVGIGTANPGRKLDVLDASNPQLRLTRVDGSTYVDLQTDVNGILNVTGSNATYNALAVGTTDTVRGIIVAAGHATGVNTGGTLRVDTSDDHDGTIDYYYVAANNDDLEIGPSTDPDNLKYDGGLNAWVVTGAATKVGIGDTSPLSLFTVGSGDKFRVDASGNATSSGWFNVGTTDVVGTLGSLIGAGDLYVGGNATVTDSLMVISSGDAYGYIVSSASGKKAYLNFSESFPNNSDVYGYVGYEGAGNDVYLYNEFNDPEADLFLGTANATRMTIKGSGGVNIAGDTKISANASTTGWFSIGTTNPITLGATIGAGDLFVGDDATITGHLSLAGLTTSAAAQTKYLCLNAAGEAISDSTACLVSSLRFKHDIKSLDISGSDIIKVLQPVTFYYNDTFKGDPNLEIEQIGLIAEAVNQIDPRLVSVDNNGLPKAIKWENLTAVLIKAVQEQQAEIDELQVSLPPDAADLPDLAVIDNPDLDIETLVVRQAATFYGTIYVKGEAMFEHKVVFKDDVEVEGKLYLSADQAGTVVLPAGATSTEVVFGGEFKSVPKVVASLATSFANDTAATDDLGLFVNWRIAAKTARGFRIVLQAPAEKNVTYDWLAIGLNSQGEPPVISEFVVSRDTVGVGIPVELWAKVTDSDTAEADLTYTWQISPQIGTVDGNSGLVYWTVDQADADTDVTITVTVSDGSHSASQSKNIRVLAGSPRSAGVAGGPTEEPTPATPTRERGEADDSTMAQEDTSPTEEPTPESGDEPTVVLGCTDTEATNYNAEATEDDGSCVLPIAGCTDPEANNYDTAAMIDDGNCTYPEPVAGTPGDEVAQGEPPAEPPAEDAGGPEVTESGL